MPQSNKDFLKFKGISFVGKSSIGTQTEVNLNHFLNWSMLNIGAFFNVDNIPESGAYGGDYSRLRLVNDPNYTNGQVWEAARSNWVYETGVAHSTQPIQISGVVVNNTFHPTTGTGSFSHYINHPYGRVVFDSAIDTSSTVKLRYSYKWVNIIDSDNPWFKELQFGSRRPDHSHFLQKGSGAWDVLSHNRLQLPAIVVDASDKRVFQGYQLGGGQWVRSDVYFHVFAETAWERNQIQDILSIQNEKSIFFFDVNTVDNATGFPLDYKGSLVSNAYMYPRLVDMVDQGGFRWKKVHLINTSIQSAGAINPHLFGGIVKTTIEMIMTDI